MYRFNKIPHTTIQSKFFLDFKLIEYFSFLKEKKEKVITKKKNECHHLKIPKNNIH